jgi:hypothetical protein
MLTKEEFGIYRNELIKARAMGIYSIVLLAPVLVRNKRFTSGLIPLKTDSIKNACWADQWKALSGKFSGRYQCACCGKFIFSDVDDIDCKKIAEVYRKSGVIHNCAPESLQVQGGHIVLLEDIIAGNGSLLAQKGSTYIAPLCKECNNSNVNTLKLAAKTVITPELR